MRSVVLPAALLIAVVAAPARARVSDSLEVSANPNIALAPATVVVKVVVPPDSENRAVEIAADSGTFFRLSECPLDGELGPRTTIVKFGPLPAGRYDVSATVLGVNGSRRATVHTEVKVLD